MRASCVYSSGVMGWMYASMHAMRRRIVCEHTHIPTYIHASIHPTYLPTASIHPSIHPCIHIYMRTYIYV